LLKKIKNIVLAQRIYQEVITDGIEDCFSFAGLDIDNCLFNKEKSMDI